MEVAMKQKEKQCIDYAKKHIKSWEAYCIAKDAWLAGYAAAKEAIIQDMKVFKDNLDNACAGDGGTYVGLAAQGAAAVGESLTLVIIKDGEHQIGQKSTD